MIQLSETGTYLVNGTELVADNAEAAAAIRVKTGREVDKAEASKETIAYGILKIIIPQTAWTSSGLSLTN